MPARPNIVFIVADDLGFADLGCYGGRVPVSPVLDRLAARGLRFTQGYANSPVCSPTRFALMTGRYQYRLRGAAEEPINSRSRGSTTLGLPPEHPTLPSLLRAAGYRTALVGKWHLGYPPAFGPLRSGYDEFFGPMSGGVDYFTHCDSRGAARPLARRGGASRGGLSHRPDLEPRVDAIERFAAPGGAPFFLSVHYTAPHWPWETRDDAAVAAEVKDNLFHLHGGNIHTYRRMIEHMDEGIGRIVAALEARRRRPRHAPRLHQRQRRRALLRQLAAGRRQDGPHRRRHPRALDRPLAGADRAGRHQRPGVHDDGLVGDDARRRRRRRRPGVSARRRLAAAGARRSGPSLPAAAATGA